MSGHRPVARLRRAGASAARLVVKAFDRRPPVPEPPPPPGAPAGSAEGIRPTALGEDASRLPRAPGSYEWWNFFAIDAASEVTVSAIFMPANLFDTRYRAAVHEYRRSAGRGVPPDPRRFPLLQLNVVSRGRKVFTSIRNLPATTTDFSTSTPRGRIGASTFEATIEDGSTAYRVRIDAPDMSNLARLEADLTFRAAEGGFAVEGGGIFGALPGGDRHQWQFPLGLPETEGRVRVVNRRGRVKFESALTGGGYTDHFWGEGLLGDVLGSWYFGRVDLGGGGALIWMWLTPRAPAAAGYGRAIHLAPGRAPVLHLARGFVRRNETRGALGLPFAAEVALLLDEGTVEARFERPLVEDWPFQVAGEGRFDVDLPGVSVSGAGGPIEHLVQSEIDDPLFVFLSRLLDRVPRYRS